MTAPAGSALLDVLADAQALGFLGPGPLDRHLEHASRFASAFATAPRRVLDLGSGGGLPGLVLATAWPASSLVLLDASERRTDLLERAVGRLGMQERVSVLRGRAEEVARSVNHRGAYDAVVARSFGPPAVVAECAAGFLRIGGALVVSEPPGSHGERWVAPELAALGLVPAPSPRGYQRLEAVALCPDRFPRRDGVPAKRPLF